MIPNPGAFHYRGKSPPPSAVREFRGGADMRKNPAVPPIITAPPADATITQGNTGEFDAAASGTPTPTVQWQISTDGGVTWSNLTDGATYSGSQTGSLTVTSVTYGMSGYQFRAVFTNTKGTATTTAATLTVNPILPAGSLLGAWYGDQFDATRIALPNAASVAGLSPNIINAPRSLFNNTNFYSNTSVTVVDNAVTGPDGLAQASTVVWGSADAYLQVANDTWPAGTYTFSIDIKTTDSSTVSFRMGPNASLSTKSATSSWTTQSVTFTLASPGDPTLLLRSLNSSTPANLAICNWRVHSGSSDLGADVSAGHMYFGRDKYYTSQQPTVSGSVLTPNSSSKFGIVQLPGAVTTLTDWTAICVCKSLSASTALETFLTKAESYTDFSAALRNTYGGAVFQYAGASPINQGYSDNSLWQNNTGTWNTVVNRYSGSEASLWLEDVKMIAATDAGLTTTIQNLFAMNLGAFGVYPHYAFYAMALYNRALSDAEVAQAAGYLKNRANTNASISVGNSRFLAAEGDSITFGAGASVGAYPNLFAPDASPTLNGRVFAVTNSTLANVVSRAATVDAMLPANKLGRKFILSVLIGRNDLNGYSGGNTQYAADVASYCAARKSAGWDDVVIVTVLPSTLSGFNTNRDILNAIYTGAGWAAANGVIICDFASDPTMGPDAAASNTSLYSDGTHPTDLGQQTLEPVYQATINGI